MRLKFSFMRCDRTVPCAAADGLRRESDVRPLWRMSYSPAMTGRTFGGQQPVVGATISVVAMGTSGYGSTGIILASTTDGSAWQLQLCAGSVFVSAVEHAGVPAGHRRQRGAGQQRKRGAGRRRWACCAVAKQDFVVMNEVTTTAAAFVAVALLLDDPGRSEWSERLVRRTVDDSGGTIGVFAGPGDGQRCDVADDCDQLRSALPNSVTTAGFVVESRRSIRSRTSWQRA